MCLQSLSAQLRPDHQRPAQVARYRPSAQAVISRAFPPAGEVLHVMRERDVGLFSLVQQVVANVAWARHEGRVPIADFRERCCYWTPRGHAGAASVWEYYFEPVVDGYPADAIPDPVRSRIDQDIPDMNHIGYWATAGVWVTSHYGDHSGLRGKAPAIPYMDASPDAALRRWTSDLMRRHVRPREYVRRKADAFFAGHLEGRDVIGVHVRGTDAVSVKETRAYRQGSLDLDRYVRALSALLQERPRARIFVATDAQGSLDHLAGHFGDRMLAYDTERHRDGDPAGAGPTGLLMPAYIAADRDAAARNGEDAVAELLLLGRCSHLVHNGAGLALTALLRDPALRHTNTHPLARAV